MQTKINIALNECSSIIEHIRKSINDVDNGCSHCKQIPCGKLKELDDKLSVLCKLIAGTNPIENDIIQKRRIGLKSANRVNPYDFGGIITVIKILQYQYKRMDRTRIFISHSSKDRNIVEKFADHILQLGIGIKSENIFCTSIEDMAISNGEDIRKHIQENIRTADYSFLLISKKYKASEICMNEMGAVWANDSNVRLYLLPDVNFGRIGWLCDTRKAEYINDAVALDELHKEMVEYYALPNNGTTWSRQRESFIDEIKKLQISYSATKISTTKE